MNISSEALWATISSVVTGVILLLMGRFVSSPDRAGAEEQQFHKSIQEELHDVRDESARNRDDADKYRVMYYEALDNLHEGGSVKDVLETLNSLDARSARVELLLAQHLRDGVYLLVQGMKHDEAVIEAFAQLNIVLPTVEYQKDKALGAKNLLDALEKQEENNEQSGDR
jgi:hypothetical protein